MKGEREARSEGEGGHNGEHNGERTGGNEVGVAQARDGGDVVMVPSVAECTSCVPCASACVNCGFSLVLYKHTEI